MIASCRLLWRSLHIGRQLIPLCKRMNTALSNACNACADRKHELTAQVGSMVKYGQHWGTRELICWILALIGKVTNFLQFQVFITCISYLEPIPHGKGQCLNSHQQAQKLNSVFTGWHCSAGQLLAWCRICIPASMVMRKLVIKAPCVQTVESLGNCRFDYTHQCYRKFHIYKKFLICHPSQSQEYFAAVLVQSF